MDGKSRTRRQVWAWVLGVWLAGCSAPVEISGTVIGIADGDTLTVLTAERQSIKVRLAEIDAPEQRQAFGERSIHRLPQRQTVEGV